MERDRKLLWFIPAEEAAAGATATNVIVPNCRILVWDVLHKVWRIWTNWNMGAGVVYSDERLWWQGKTPSTGVIGTISDDLTDAICRNAEGNDVHDMWDRLHPIEFQLTTGWETLDEPSLKKIFKRFKLYAPQLGGTEQYSLTVTAQRNFRNATSDVFVVPITLTVRTKIFRLMNQSSEALRYIFTHAIGGQKVEISGWEHEVVVPSKPEIKGLE
jgi:hypothetical protein